jgi:hypothetical protein
MSSSEIIFQEVKHRRKILINQHPVILEPNIQKNFNYFFGTESKFFIMYLKKKILRSRFLPFLNDFRYARATIKALCSRGLTTTLPNQRIYFSNNKKIKLGLLNESLTN